MGSVKNNKVTLENLLKLEPVIQGEINVVDAVNKQIPMEVVDVYTDAYHCPSCGKEIPFDNSPPFPEGKSPFVNNFCPNCGQRLIIGDHLKWL